MKLGTGRVTLALLATIGLIALMSGQARPAKLAPTSAVERVAKRGIRITGATARNLATNATRGWNDRYDVEIDPSEVRVLDFDQGPAQDLIIITKGLTIDRVATQPVGNGYRLITEVSDSEESSGWAHKRTRCFKRVKGPNSSWIDHCFQLHRLTHDGSKERDYYALHRYATAKARDDDLRIAHIRSYRHEDGPKMTWADWSPRGDVELDCDSYTIGITFKGVSLSRTYEVCDKWDVTKYRAPGKFANTWDGEARNTEREVAFMIAVGVRQGASPRWHHRSEVLAL